MSEPVSGQRIWDFFAKPIDQDELVDAENSVDELYALCDDPMQVPVKLVNDQLRFTDLAAVQDLFVENSGFLVVGAVGLQGAGKSSVLNVLANQLTSQTRLFDGPFPVQSTKNFLTNSPRTGGVDLYITQDRVILLDTQPLMSFALTNYHTQSSSAHPSAARIELNTLTAEDTSISHNTLVGPNNWSLDVWAEMASIQIVSFLLNVCHVVLVVTDSLDTAPTRVHRLIDLAASLKPTVYTASVLRHEEDRLATGLVNTTNLTDPNGQKSAVTAAPCHGAVKNGLRVNPNFGFDRNFKHMPDEEVEVECASYADGQSGSPPVASADVARSSVGPSVLFSRSEHEPKHSQPFDTEASDVVEALNRLKCLTDYSASLIHVYNQAPSAAFLDSAVCQKVDIYRHQLLPMVYPDYRRMVALTSVGPRILSAHLTSRLHQQTVMTNTLAAVEERGPNLSSLDRSARVGASTIAADTAVQEGEPASVDLFASDQCGGRVATNRLVESLALSCDGDGVDDVNVLNEVRSSGTGSGADSNEDGRILKATEQLSPVLSEHGTRNVNSEFVDGDVSYPNQRTGYVKVLVNLTSWTSLLVMRLMRADRFRLRILIRERLFVIDLTTWLIFTLCLHSIISGYGNISKYQVQTLSLTTCTLFRFRHSRSTAFCKETSKSQSHSETAQQVGPTEVEIAAECCQVLHAVQTELDRLLGDELLSQSGEPDSPESAVDEYELDDRNWDGEKLNARMTNLTHQVRSVRRDFFNVQRRLSKPRFFLIPEVDDEGHSPVGCPIYSNSVRSLQEAILSTPRQHMIPQLTEKKWIAYAQQMWDAVCTSPILSDYHSILTN
ncbi:uncharacterized protein DEA37_0013641 [Paragonimus westermani]|uniref:Protein SMG9 n=1 Tax=Paragonimus westermani TaxID=34504 RepID=A0A5J4NW48_9TREM|nr:uncharacterized protein DEA37_0013641 [Paragonimus westermani]